MDDVQPIADASSFSVFDSTKKYSSVQETLSAEPAIAAAISYLFRLGVPTNACSEYLASMSVGTFATQGLKTYVLSVGGVDNVPKVYADDISRVPISIRRTMYAACRKFAIASAPLEAWRRDPAIALCIQQLINEPCTNSFTMQTKASIVHEVLASEGINIKVATIRKAIAENLLRPDVSLLELYTAHDLGEMRSRANAIIAHSRKNKEDAKRFEHSVWKSKSTCIQIAEAIKQGASVGALCFVAKQFGEKTSPEFWQAFLSRTRIGGTRVKTDENRMAAIHAIQLLHDFDDTEQAAAAITVAHTLGDYRKNVKDTVRFQSEVWKNKEACAAIAYLYGMQFNPDSIASFIWRYYRIHTTESLFRDALNDAESYGMSVREFFSSKSDASAMTSAKALLDKHRITEDTPIRELAEVLSICHEMRSKNAFTLVRNALRLNQSERTIIPLLDLNFYEHNGVRILRIRTNVHRLKDARAEGADLKKHEEFMYFFERLSRLTVLKPPSAIREFFAELGVDDIELQTHQRVKMRDTLTSRRIRVT